LKTGEIFSCRLPDSPATFCIALKRFRLIQCSAAQFHRNKNFDNTTIIAFLLCQHCVIRMKFMLHPWQLLRLILAVWINRQKNVIEQLREEVLAYGSRYKVLRGVPWHSGTDRCEGSPVTTRSPNLNPNLERFMRSIKEECLD
jgi:hypothetical protein